MSTVVRGKWFKVNDLDHSALHSKGKTIINSSNSIIDGKRIFLKSAN
jgi:hypothetical protein